MSRTYNKKGLSRETLMQFSRQRVGLADCSLLTEVELKYVGSGAFYVGVNRYTLGANQQNKVLCTKSLGEAREAWRTTVLELFGEKIASARKTKMFRVVYHPALVGRIELAPWVIVTASGSMVPVRCETAEEAWLEVCWKMRRGIDKDTLQQGEEND